jgi:hypothetical protein
LPGIPCFKLKEAVMFGLLISCICAGAQSAGDPLRKAGASSTLTFLTKDGSCWRGTVLKADPTSITVQPLKEKPVGLRRDELLQVSQGNALVFSARSSWLDVVNVHLYPRELLVLVTKTGKKIEGVLVNAGSDSITIKHGLTTSKLPKAEVLTVDYLRWRPASDGFNIALEESPWALVFYPEFYGRVAGAEGKVAVRLYDASKPEDDSKLSQKTCFP